MKRLARLQAVSPNPKISHTWTWFRQIWERRRGKKKKKQLHCIQTHNTLDGGFILQLLWLLFIMSIQLCCCDGRTSAPLPHHPGSKRSKTLVQRPAFLPLSFLGFRYWLCCGCRVLRFCFFFVFLPSLSSSTFGCHICFYWRSVWCAAAAAVYNASTHQLCLGFSRREAPATPEAAPRRWTPTSAVRPLLHLPEWRTSPGKGDDATKGGTTRGRDAGKARQGGREKIN